jgi:hypothetical protein
MNDFFLENRYYNYEKIVAAKKKFDTKIADVSYSVRISNAYNYDSVIKTYGVLYSAEDPSTTNEKVQIEKIRKDTFKFTEGLGYDTLVFYGNKNFVSKVINISDSFSNNGKPYPPNTTVKRGTTDKILKNETPDKRYWAYRIFYLFL